MNKKMEIVLMLAFVLTLLVGCMPQSYAPLQYGDLYNLYPGFTEWLSTKGDALVKWFSNGSTGMEVYARPFQDGWAVAVRKGNEAYGFFMNNQTWTDFREWLVNFGGFAEMIRQLPNIMQMPVFVVPILSPVDGMPCMPGITPCGGLK